jgi:hypothetical protein
VRGLPAALLAAREALEEERLASVRSLATVPPPAESPGDDAEQMTLF